MLHCFVVAGTARTSIRSVGAPDGAMPPGQRRYLLVGEKFRAPRVFRHWIHAIAAMKKTLHK